MTTDDKTRGFVDLLDRAIGIVQERIKLRKKGIADVALLRDLEHIANGLSRYRDEALSGKLPPSEGVVTIGILREVGDWGEPSDSPLFKIAQDLERYYKERMK